MKTFNLGYYFELLQASGRLGLCPGIFICAAWLGISFSIAMCLHPSDMVRFEHLGGQVPDEFTFKMLAAGEVKALVVLAGFGLLLQGALVLFYRRARFSVSLWPVAGIFLGVIGNLIWWGAEASHGFDFGGFLAGLAPLALTVMAEAQCEQWGQDFVFGPGVRPGRG